MAIYNTVSDSSNTAVRALLTKIGEYYWGKSFNTGSGKSKRIWESIRDEIFNGECAYCKDKNSKLQIEHLIMFNRTQFGLHHPGNVVPVCNDCNKRRKNKKKEYLDWKDHLLEICLENDTMNTFESKRDKILNHMNEGEFKYPNLNETERNAIRVIANSLYENIKSEGDKSLRMYMELDKVFVKNKQ
ncbi:HNH endonuclease [Aquimarina macrocephali]|uniref:HNH endonuclease n=1 Tax=Aquimarina macrocephali TaxID=666563 RepID=UPI00046425E4|nr:HNH endonuclease [Aquimarina macrocephali]